MVFQRHFCPLQVENFESFARRAVGKQFSEFVIRITSEYNLPATGGNFFEIQEFCIKNWHIFQLQGHFVKISRTFVKFQGHFVNFKDICLFLSKFQGHPEISRAFKD